MHPLNAVISQKAAHKNCTYYGVESAQGLRIRGGFKGSDGGDRPPPKTGLGGFFYPNLLVVRLSVLQFYIDYVNRFLQLHTNLFARSVSTLASVF
jgi:hypothetical protein